MTNILFKQISTYHLELSRRAVLALLILLLSACGKSKNESTPTSIPNEAEQSNPLTIGKELFEGEGKCFSCHKPDSKVVGPSIIEIAQIYKDSNADMVAFLKGNADPIVDPEQYEVMKVNIEITKTMTDEQLKAIEAYMYSHLK